MSRASLQFPLKAGPTDWGSATLGRPRGRGFVKNDVLDADVICNGSGKVVAALVEDTRLVGRTNLGRARGPGEAIRASSPTSVKPLRLVAMKDEEGRIRMMPQSSLKDQSNTNVLENGVDDKKKETHKNGSLESGKGQGNKNVSQGCNLANDATAMRGITMKDGGWVGGLGKSSSTKVGAEEVVNSKKMFSEMMSTQAGHTVKRTGPKLPVEKKLEKCFLCGKPSEDQVRSAKQFFFTGIFSTWDFFQAFKH